MAEPIQPRVNPKLVTPTDSAFVTPGDPVPAEIQTDRLDHLEDLRTLAPVQGGEEAPPSHLQTVEGALDTDAATEPTIQIDTHDV